MTNLNRSEPTKESTERYYPKDNFGLSRHEFELFTKKVKEGDESLFIKVFNIQFKESVRFIQNKYGISKEVAYDICMDTMVEFRMKLIRGKIHYGNLKFLFTRMASNNYLDSLKKSKRVKDAIHVFLGENQEEELSNIEFLRVLNDAIDRLNSKQKAFIRDLFYAGKSKEEMEKEYDISNATFRKRKQRSLNKLKGVFLEILKRKQI
ncbi:MAG: sigma-70 family RNA polymerase sigma factor [Saprospiraceae bacterium]|nr:sigma-70 family RNA polymerase sigma factor [Saprospiraceae bacterium]